MKLILCLHINVIVFLKPILSLSLYVVRNAQITQNNKFAISLQYLEKKRGLKLIFLHAFKHESLPQFDTIILIGMIKHYQNPQNIKFAMS